jgi:metallo-beta-lactamase family protein
VKIKFLGAAGTVTGSSYVLTSDSGESMLIDLGMFQGPEAIEKLNYEKYDYDTSQLTGAVLTHAHLDHCGRLPFLLKGGFKGNIWMTPPTAELAEIVLMDSAKIAKEDKDQILYDKKLATETAKQFVKVHYRDPFKIGGFNVVFRDAGHILGSASLEITDTKAEGGINKIVFSGDLGNSPEELVCPTELINSADAVVMESTYGGRYHPNDNPMDAIESEINVIENKGGTLLIPSFSLEKTQELLYAIKRLKREGRVKPDTPVYLDSPMAEKATVVYLEQSSFLNEQVQDEIGRGIPFEFPGLTIIRDYKDSKDLQYRTGQVIIAGSGMMVGGRIVNHAANFLPLDTTRLFIVGYQAEETLGRELLEGKKEVVIEGVTIFVKAQVNSTQAMSSHADTGQLLNWLKNINGVKKVFLTHGDDEERKVLAEKIASDLQISDVVLPLLNQEFTM